MSGSLASLMMGQEQPFAQATRVPLSSMTVNPLASTAPVGLMAMLGDSSPQPVPIMAPDDPNRVTMGDAYTSTKNTLGDWIAAQRADAVSRGLWNDQTGMPTQAGLTNALQQYGGALMAGTSAPSGPHDALPMDTISRMSRANDMGFTINAYHGGPGTNPYDDSAAGAMGTIKDFRPGPEGVAFFTDNPALASDYATARNPDRAAVYPVKINAGNVMTYDQANGFKSNAELIDMGRQAGARSVEVQNAHDNVPGGKREASTVYMVLDPTSIRSPFAKFDPMARNSSNITAGVAGLTAAGLAAAGNRSQ